jgi:hypothetical protein
MFLNFGLSIVQIYLNMAYNGITSTIFKGLKASKKK